MDKNIIKQIQKRIIQLLPADKQGQPSILLTDNCSEVSRLAANWIKILDKSSRIFILKGVNVCCGLRAHDILAVIASDSHVYIIDPTIWQFFSKKKSILLFKTNNIDIALNKIKMKYGGEWSISENFVQMSKNDEKKCLRIIEQNINEILSEYNDNLINDKESEVI